MFAAVYFCIRDDHDFRLAAIAGLICVAASFATVRLVRHASGAEAQFQWRWVLAAGVATGFGIWATHFIAMLGYDPGLVIGYHLGSTIASLALAIISAVLGIRLALRPSGRTGLTSNMVLGAALVGVGATGMHYLGMMAVELPGVLSWSLPHVALSLPLAVVPMIPAFRLALTKRGTGNIVAASALTASAILLMHFMGMGGLRITPGRNMVDQSYLLSPLAMGLSIAATAFALLLSLMVAALISARARTAIAERQREFSLLVQGVKDCAITLLDQSGRVSSWNVGAERLTGYREVDVVGQLPAFFHDRVDDDAFRLDEALATALKEGSYQGAGWLRRKDGTRFWAHMLVEALHDEQNAFVGYAKLIRDMTRFREDQERLAVLTRNLDAALSHMHQGLGLFDADERLVLFNPQVEKILGCPPDTIRTGIRFEDLVRTAMELRTGGRVPQFEVDAALERQRACLARPNGGSVVSPFHQDRSLLITYSPRPEGGWVTTLEDITERRHAEQRIEYMALHDPLTGLPNRISYNERLEGVLAQAGRDGAKVAVIGIDLDRFKDINDTHGHNTGDALLCKLADRLSATQAQDEFIGRFGGDEFAAFKVFPTQADLSDFIDRLEACLNTPVALGELTVTPGASLGVALFPQDGEDGGQLARKADLAMYRAKAAINRTTSFYEHGMDEAVRARRMLSNDLRGAESRGELSLAYQVQRSVIDQQVVGFEALLRWNHPTAGCVPPDRFIPIAEESGDIVRIGAWVLRAACEEAAQWPQPWRVAVNLSPVQLMQTELVELVVQTLLDTGLPARRLELEITETALIGDKARALHILRQIKALGVSIAIDDFGTGYSSLDTLHSFPFDKIKIDKSFLIDSASNPQARAIIRAVLALGQSLSLPVLAEGLESAEQLELLRLEGCTEAQGYFFGRPGAMSGEGTAVAMPTESSRADYPRVAEHLSVGEKRVARRA